MFKCSCRRMKCDEASDAWSNLRISHIHVFLKNLGQHVPRKKNLEFAKVRRKNFLFGEEDVFQMKEFRTTLIYINTFFIYIIYIFYEYICSHWSTPRTCFLHHLQVECCRIFAAKYWDVARDNQNFTARTEGESHGVLVADGWWRMRFEQGSWKLYIWVVK